MKSLKVPGNVMLRGVSQLAIMLDVGVTAYNAVRSLALNEPTLKMREFLKRVENSISNGMRLSEALSLDPTPFNESQIAMIEAGETGGFLPQIFVKISNTLESGEELKRQLKSSLTFPLATVVIAIGILIYMLINVIPNFVSIFREANVKLPALTQFVVNLSDIASTYPIVTVGLAGGLCYTIYMFPTFVNRTPMLQTMVLRLPAVGQFLRDTMVAQFFSLMGQLISAGVTLERSLVIAQGLSNFAYYKSTINKFIQDIRSGVTLSVSMGQTELFGPANAQILQTGEDSGRMGEILNLVGHRYENELTYKLKQVSTYAELAAIAFSGVIVGIIVYAMFIPMLDLSSTIK
jgi:type IV pilus assembly protein PilC